MLRLYPMATAVAFSALVAACSGSTDAAPTTTSSVTTPGLAPSRSEALTNKLLELKKVHQAITLYCHPTTPPGQGQGDQGQGDQGQGDEGQTGPSQTGDQDAAPPAAVLSDGQIAAVTLAANIGEVQAGLLAETRAADPRVRAFATKMITDHTDAKRKQDARLAPLGIRPVTTDLSTLLTRRGDGALEALAMTADADFDKAYVDAQVSAHEQVLALVDDQLLPSVTDASFRAFLTDVRGAVAMHLDAARALQSALSTTP